MAQGGGGGLAQRGLPRGQRGQEQGEGCAAAGTACGAKRMSICAYSTRSSSPANAPSPPSPGACKKDCHQGIQN